MSLNCATWQTCIMVLMRRAEITYSSVQTEWSMRKTKPSSMYQMTCFSVKVRPLKSHEHRFLYFNFFLLDKENLKKTDDAKNNHFPSCSFLVICSVRCLTQHSRSEAAGVLILLATVVSFIWFCISLFFRVLIY